MLQLTLIIGLALIVTGADARSKKKHVRHGPQFRAERIEHSLRNLAPNERLIQLCDVTAMQRVRKEQPDFKPDRAIADAITTAVVEHNTVTAPGGALRSGGKWYELSYSCTGAADNMKVEKFSYKIGAAIPEEKWAAYNLWQ